MLLGAEEWVIAERLIHADDRRAPWQSPAGNTRRPTWDLAQAELWRGKASNMLIVSDGVSAGRHLAPVDQLAAWREYGALLLIDDSHVRASSMRREGQHEHSECGTGEIVTQRSQGAGGGRAASRRARSVVGTAQPGRPDRAEQRSAAGFYVHSRRSSSECSGGFARTDETHRNFRAQRQAPVSARPGETTIVPVMLVDGRRHRDGGRYSTKH